jgi:hypothetical protein
MRMPRAIPVNPSARVRVIRLDEWNNVHFGAALNQDQRPPRNNRQLGARGRVIEYLWGSDNLFWVEHDDGSRGIYEHSEVDFEDQRLYLPDCRKCGCFAVSHVPVRNTSMNIRCLSCKKCSGYDHPTVSNTLPFDADHYWDPETGHLERLEDDEVQRED